jgi:hypothetical protein
VQLQQHVFDLPAVKRRFCRFVRLPYAGWNRFGKTKDSVFETDWRKTKFCGRDALKFNFQNGNWQGY